jgi:hypothetical protein
MIIEEIAHIVIMRRHCILLIMRRHCILLKEKLPPEITVEGSCTVAPPH